MVGLWPWSKHGYVHSYDGEVVFACSGKGVIDYARNRSEIHNDIMLRLPWDSCVGWVRGTIYGGELQLFPCIVGEQGVPDEYKEGYISKQAVASIMDEVLSEKDAISTVWLEFYNTGEHYQCTVEEAVEVLSEVDLEA